MKCTVDLELTPAPPGKGLLDPENVPTYVFTGGEVVVAEDEEVELAVRLWRVCPGRRPSSTMCGRASANGPICLRSDRASARPDETCVRRGRPRRRPLDLRSRAGCCVFARNDERVRHIHMNGVDLKYVAERTGIPAVFLHGRGSDLFEPHSVFRDLRRWLELPTAS